MTAFWNDVFHFHPLPLRFIAFRRPQIVEIGKDGGAPRGFSNPVRDNPHIGQLATPHPAILVAWLSGQGCRNGWVVQQLSNSYV